MGKNKLVKEPPEIGIKLFAIASNNVGIGTTTPMSYLYVDLSGKKRKKAKKKQKAKRKQNKAGNKLLHKHRKINTK